MTDNANIKNTKWQDFADKSIVKDGEKGTTIRVKPEPDDSEEHEAPQSNWPY